MGFARVLDVSLVVVRTQVLVVVAAVWLSYACLTRGGDGDQRGSHICALQCTFVDASEALL